ncbi:MAG: helix-turn-helix transcriptional regulator [Thermodesulfobacteriota bacterium]|nr:helix-turn-helix transcriptional regulator [Thermodesulfobacteriota bacterium]
MREHMRESITAEFADVCIRVPTTEVDRVKSALSKFLELAGVKYSIQDNEDLLTWEEAFPELGPGDVLKGARDREGLTQTELAAKIGVKPHHISEMENGKRSIGKDIARRLAKALNTGYKVFL